MSKTILTQENVFVNYENVISIVPVCLEGESDSGEIVTAYELSANVVTPVPNNDIESPDETTISLGIYSSEEELKLVIKKLTNWLNERKDYGCLFKTPLEGEVAPTQYLHNKQEE